MKQFAAHLDKRPGWWRGLKWMYDSMHFVGDKRRVRVVVPSVDDMAKAAAESGMPDMRKPDSTQESHWMTKCVLEFANKAQKWDEVA